MVTFTSMQPRVIKFSRTPNPRVDIATLILNLHRAMEIGVNPPSVKDDIFNEVRTYLEDYANSQAMVARLVQQNSEMLETLRQVQREEGMGYHESRNIEEDDNV